MVPGGGKQGAHRPPRAEATGQEIRKGQKSRNISCNSLTL